MYISLSISVVFICALSSQKARGIQPMLFQCRSSVFDAGPTLKQQWWIPRACRDKVLCQHTWHCGKVINEFCCNSRRKKNTRNNSRGKTWRCYRKMSAAERGCARNATSSPISCPLFPELSPKNNRGYYFSNRRLKTSWYHCVTPWWRHSNYRRFFFTPPPLPSPRVLSSLHAMREQRGCEAVRRKSHGVRAAVYRVGL